MLQGFFNTRYVMNRAGLMGGMLLALAGCQLPAEKVALMPLPETVTPQPYAGLVSRARAQAGAANDAFYDNKWADLEEAAKGLERTAEFLNQASEVPAKHKASLPVESGDLSKLASRLREAAKSKDEKQMTETMQKINLKVRELRPE
jgi:hypothetical protein